MRKFGKEHLIVQALNPSHLVEYQSGSIVSQTIIERDVGTITLFAFDEGQGLTEHTAPYDALVYVLDGKAEDTILSKT